MGLDGLYSALSGIRNDSLWLDVIGNNIANVNTVGYKTSRAEFLSSISQTMGAGSADNPMEGLGGTNPVQVGLGSGLAQIDSLFTQGNIQTTGQSLDVAIQGNGFLVAKQGDQTFLTRDGDLSLDSNGNLVDNKGGLIQGYNASTQYSRLLLNSVSSTGGPAYITYSNLTLNNTDPANITDIHIDPNMTLAPKATTEINFSGNLDSFQQPNVLNLDPPQGFTLPVGVMLSQIPPPNGIDTTRMTTVNLPGGGFALQQVSNLSTPAGGTQDPSPLVNGLIDLLNVQANAGNYAWEQQPPLAPATQVQETVYDSLGTPHQITTLFYQVNDLGADGINNPTAAGQSQVCYAWYAFDTSNGQPVSTANLLGGTGIWEGDMVTGFGSAGGYDRGTPNQESAGDFIWFNTDGSLASSGGMTGPPSPPGPPNVMVRPTIFLPAFNQFPPNSPPPSDGAQITAVQLNFGTFGALGTGKRDGLFSDAEGSYQVVNGVNTYVPQFTAHAASQDGYADGTLQGLSVDRTGTLQGTFSNGQVVALAQLSMATVNNPEGLESVGNGYYEASNSSGVLEQSLAGKDGLGTIQGGALENSNVDLTVELSNMIIAQRGFEANAREVSVINSTLQTLAALGEVSAA